MTDWSINEISDEITFPDRSTPIKTGQPMNTTVVRLREIRDGLATVFCDVHDLDVESYDDSISELLSYIAPAIVVANNLLSQEKGKES